LGGIPATIGGALVIMNAGGRFGQIGDVVQSVRAVDRSGIDVVLDRREIHFDYRRSGLGSLILTVAEFMLAPADREKLRAFHKDVMAYKAESRSRSRRIRRVCVFKNPTLLMDIEGIGAKGQCVSAGMLIDRAGCKGLSVGGARVSERHGNFIVTSSGCTASNVIDLMEIVSTRVMEAFRRPHRSGGRDLEA
jgi:UDP-N-acetylmuramate dehydrogenase